MIQEEGPLDRQRPRIEPRILLSSISQERNASTVMSQKTKRKLTIRKKKNKRKEKKNGWRKIEMRREEKNEM